MYWTGAAAASTGALQHLHGASILASAAIAHSDQRDTTSITTATSCSLLSREGCVLQTLCQTHFHLSLQTLILGSVKPLKGFLSRLPYLWLLFGIMQHVWCWQIQHRIITSPYLFPGLYFIHIDLCPPHPRMLLCCVSTVAQTDR